jgi:anthranilate/para-aminobenzoate synthase component II
MQILVISIGSASTEEFESYAPKYQLVTVQPATIPATLDEFSAIVVSGAYEATMPGRFELVQLLAGLDKPLIGVGIGYEVLCQVLGIDLDALADCAVGATRIIPTDDGAKLFQGTDPLLVKESMRWLVEELPKSCQVLARSDSGIEAFRHKKRPLTAIQQLPDDFTYPSDAKMVYANLFAALGK